VDFVAGNSNKLQKLRVENEVNFEGFKVSIARSEGEK
jgi:hypothetical protein